MSENLGTFVNQVLKIEDEKTARQFFQTRVAFLRVKHPEIKNPEKALQSDIGYCFGEGMALARRRMWNHVCGAEHPVAGSEYTNRDYTPEELLKAGMLYAQRRIREQTYPSAWQLVMSERFED